MDDIQLNWAEATVEDARLTVPLEGEPPSGWRKSFERTVQLLGPGAWGEVEVKKRTIRVRNVQAGDEEKLRHFLEGAVEQANEANRPGDTDAGEDQERPAEGPDARMTERFRAFAGERSETDSETGSR